MIFRKRVVRKRLDARTRKARAIAHHLIRWDLMRQREYVVALFDAIRAAGTPRA